MKKEKDNWFELKNGEWILKPIKNSRYNEDKGINFGRWFIILMIIMFFGSLFGGCPVIYLG